MEQFFNGVDAFTNWLWGPPMLIILGLGGIIMSAYLGFFQFRHMGYILKSTLGSIFKKTDTSQAHGTVSAFKAMMSALGCTIGSGNIVGVCVAIAFGGPGAVFWMWLFGLFASAFKYSEITLAIRYRKQNQASEYIGGPMYYLNKALPHLGTIYALIFIFELMPSIGNQSASIVEVAENAGIPRLPITIAIAVVILAVVYGGIRSISNVMDKVVPFMGIFYTLFCLIIIFMNFQLIPAAFAAIFKGAFAGTAAVGGFSGVAIAQALRWGLARGVGSNDAGNGQSAIAHSAAITDHPSRQGLWGVTEVFLDTIVICSMTALTVIITGVWTRVPSDRASTMAAVAFRELGGEFGSIMMFLAQFLFAITTIILLFFYGEKLAEYLFGYRASKFMKYFYMIFVILGAYGGVNLMIRLLDIFYAGIIIPNVIGLFCLRGELKASTQDFFQNYMYKIRPDNVPEPQPGASYEVTGND